MAVLVGVDEQVAERAAQQKGATWVFGAKDRLWGAVASRPSTGRSSVAVVMPDMVQLQAWLKSRAALQKPGTGYAGADGRDSPQAPCERLARGHRHRLGGGAGADPGSADHGALLDSADDLVTVFLGAVAVAALVGWWQDKLARAERDRVEAAERERADRDRHDEHMRELKTRARLERAHTPSASGRTSCAARWRGCTGSRAR